MSVEPAGRLGRETQNGFCIRGGDDRALFAPPRGAIKRGAEMRIKDQKKTCKECGGLRHGSQCMCRTGVQFMMGCCTTCNGSGESDSLVEDACEALSRTRGKDMTVFQFAS